MSKDVRLGVCSNPFTVILDLENPTKYVQIGCESCSFAQYIPSVDGG